MKSADTRKFEQLSKQRIDYTDLPDGGVRARLTLTLPNGKTMSFVDDVVANDVHDYAAQISGAEIGFAIAEVGGIGGIDEIGFLGGLVKAIGKGVKAIGNVAKKIVTSKVMQTAAKGLAIAAPALGPLAPTALAVAGGIGVAGKLLSAKNAAAVGAKRTATQLAQSAVADARRISPKAAPSLLRIASDKANSAANLTKVSNIAAGLKRGLERSSASSDVVQLARSGRVRSNLGGAVSPAQLQAAANAGRLFFVSA